MRYPLRLLLEKCVDALIYALKAVASPDIVPPLLNLLRENKVGPDPNRGESIYRPSELQCTKCHAIGGAGGRLGPDLASSGATAQVGK